MLWNLLSDRSIVYPIEVTLSGPLDSFRLWAGHQKGQAMIISLELSHTPPTHTIPNSLGRGERLEMKFIINHVYVMKPP